MAKVKTEKVDLDKHNDEVKAKLMVSASLASRVRPKSFKDIVGQQEAVLKLKGMLAKKKLPGAILITGDPGLGKTTLARVFARYLNCETYDACGTCASCKIDIDNHPDITEINMGVDRGIDDSRALVQKARYAARFNMRVIVGDECHNLTGPSEQALLKTLEEPPAGTLFILCTTNPEKMKPAVLSRCTKLQLHPVDPEELVDRLIVIAKKEGEDFDNKEGRKLLTTIANYSNGLVRDAISILEGVLFAKAGTKKADLSSIVDTFVTSLETSIDKSAARATVAYIRNGIKALASQASKVDSCRQLMMKMRWISMSVIDDYSGNLRFKSYAFRDFQNLLKEAKVPYDFKVLVPIMLDLLFKLNELEIKMNQSNIDERALFIGELCSHVLSHKKRQED
jgi:DNA polymerase-3 subunit gamma/tau